MSVKKPNQGQLVAEALPGPTFSLGKAPNSGGGGEPPRGLGLGVRLAAIPGETKPGLLTDPFYFQVAPTSAFTRTGSAEWQDFSTLAGPASRASQRGLTQYSFGSMFVDYDPTWAAYHFGTDAGRSGTPVDPYGWLDTLFEIRDSLTPVSLLVGQPGAWGRWHVKNEPVSLREVSDEYHTDEDDALYFNLSFVECPTQKLLVLDAAGKTPATITVDSAGTARWEAVSGNQTMTDVTLHKLAKWFYGDPGAWRQIANDSRNGTLDTYTGDRPLGTFAARHGRNRPDDDTKRKTVVIHVPVKSELVAKVTGPSVLTPSATGFGSNGVISR